MQRLMPRNCLTGQTSVIILNKDAATDLEVELDFGRDVERSGANRDITRTGIRQPRSSHHSVNEDRTRSSRASALLLFPMRRECGLP